MSELRWTLLILGVVFIAALSWWERRRPRQAFAPRLRDASLDPVTVPGEPWIGEAGLADVVSSDISLAGPADAHPHQPEPSGPGPLEALPTLVIPDADEQPPEPTLIDPQAIAAAEESVEAAEPIAATGPAPVDPEIFGAEGVGAVRIVERSPAPLPSSGGPVSGETPLPELGSGAAARVEPIVEWPPEESRRILALRLVAPQAERFPGRTLRLAMAAEGFVLGKFSIFHRADEANRAVLSAASLTRPGSFDLETMDSQRYGGLSLFAVLPGPKAPPQAFEDLLATARNLNERLQGALQDERGGPLTPLRVASIRDGLRAEAATLQAAAAHEA